MYTIYLIQNTYIIIYYNRVIGHGFGVHPDMILCNWVGVTKMAF